MISILLVTTAGSAELGELDCVIEPHEVVDVASRVDGIVDTIEVERGDIVVADQILVKLDSGVEAAAVAAATSRATASAEVEANNVSVDFANRRRERLQALYREAAISGDQMDEISTEASLMAYQLQRARENRRIAELELAQSMEILNRHTIHSPIDGVVVQRYLAPGESTEDQPILRIAQIDPLRVEVIVPVSAFGSIESGQQAMVYPEAPREGAFPAKVTIVDRVADAASGTFRVRLSMRNPDYSVPSGLNCRVRFLPNDGAPETTLASEDSAPAQGEIVAVVQRLTADEATQQCRMLGPFSEKAEADRMSSALHDKVDSVSKQVEQRRVDSGFIIVSEQQQSLEVARRLADDMEAAGINNLFVFGEGNNAGRVALGLYDSEEMADRQVKQLRGLGFDVERQIHRTRRPVYWLNVRLASGDKATAFDSDPALTAVPVTPTSCEKTVAKRD